MWWARKASHHHKLRGDAPSPHSILNHARKMVRIAPFTALMSLCKSGDFANSKFAFGHIYLHNSRLVCKGLEDPDASCPKKHRRRQSSML